MKKACFFILLLAGTLLQGCSLMAAAGLGSQGQPTKQAPQKLTSTTANSSINLDHSAWDRLLKKHVNAAGLVDYQGFAEDREALNGYLDMLSSQKPDDSWSVQELLAFYINLYNAYTVDLILDNPSVKSIKDIDSPWTKARVPVGDKKLSLGGIENGVLRKMNESRIHFAINCASISCPKLLDEAYTAAKINEQLEQVTRSFINSDKNDIATDRLELSKIFDWYQKDFINDKTPSLIAYINPYSETAISENAEISYKNYDWSLNDQEN